MAKKLALGTIVIAVFVFIFEFVVHGILLKDIYAQTAELWRPESQMQQYMMYMILSHLVFALFMCLEFSRNHQCQGIRGGVVFGLYIGGLFMAMNIGMYAWMPLPSLQLPIIWTIAGFVQTISIGVILTLLCCNKKEG